MTKPASLPPDAAPFRPHAAHRPASVGGLSPGQMPASSPWKVVAIALAALVAALTAFLLFP